MMVTVSRYNLSQMDCLCVDCGGMNVFPAIHNYVDIIGVALLSM
jgi:hypothetical protein